MHESPDDPQAAPPGSAPADEARRGYLVQGAALVGVIAITVIVTLWVSRDAERTGVEILIPTQAPVTFQVSGEVARPGVYSLDGEPRVSDAIDADGGLTADADGHRINLALHVRDGAKVVVPALGSTIAIGADSSSGSSNTTIDSSASNALMPGLIDLNTATKAQLVALPDIGDSRADSIIEWRAKNLVNSTSDLLAISGIGPATVDAIREHVIQP